MLKANVLMFPTISSLFRGGNSEATIRLLIFPKQLLISAHILEGKQAGEALWKRFLPLLALLHIRMECLGPSKEETSLSAHQKLLFTGGRKSPLESGNKDK